MYSIQFIVFECSLNNLLFLDQPNYTSKEIPEPLEESSAIQNELYEETESAHVAEELANSIHKSPTSQEYGTRRINIDSDITDEARNNNGI